MVASGSVFARPSGPPQNSKLCGHFVLQGLSAINLSSNGTGVPGIVFLVQGERPTIDPGKAGGGDTFKIRVYLAPCELLNFSHHGSVPPHTRYGSERFTIEFGYAVRDRTAEILVSRKIENMPPPGVDR